MESTLGMFIGIAVGALVMWLVLRFRSSFNPPALVPPADTALLEDLRHRIDDLSSRRGEDHGAIIQFLRTLMDQQQEAGRENSRLIQWLRSAPARGKWGELQLLRVVELSGLDEHCDFDEQPTIQTESTSLRPDLIVNLPNALRIAVDSKVPLDGFLEAAEATGEKERSEALTRYARAVESRVAELGRKDYWRHLDRSPDFSVLFLPGESFLQPALEKNPKLMETAIRQRVMIATPMTLIALLRSVFMGWKDAHLSEEAKEIAGLAAELHSRLEKMLSHVAALGKALDAAVKRFNDMCGSFKLRVMPAMKDLRKAGVPGGEPEIAELHRRPRTDLPAAKENQ